MSTIRKQIEARKEEFLEELSAVCRQPSISAQDNGVNECADLVSEIFDRRGFHVEKWEMDGSKPAIYAYLPGISERSLLFYGHYDIVPPDPIEAWRTPPFEPTVVGEYLFGRGVGDHKSSFMNRLHAVDIILENGPLPVGIKFFLEGEEEIGSPSLGKFIDAHRDTLKADAALYVGGFRNDEGHIQIRLGKKGNLAVELAVRTMAKDALSYRGGILPNAAWRLVRALSTMIDENDRCIIDGFCNSIKGPSAIEEQLVRRIPFSADSVCSAFGANKLNAGVDGSDAMMIEVFDPIAVLCELNAGFTGGGFKAVLPSTAKAQLEFQIVPDQTPEEVFSLLRAHLDRRGYNDITLSIINALKTGQTPADAKIAELAIQTAYEVYGEEPIVIPLGGGAGPWDLLFNIGMPLVSEPGVSHSGSNYHAPNENIKISDYLLGIEYIVTLVQAFERR